MCPIRYPTLKKIQSQEKTSNHLFSIGVRVKNEINAINYFWESIKRQSYFKNIEIVFLDSGSTDGTVEFIKGLNCNFYTISPNEFTFGDTCNLIMELTTCDYVCFFSGHVILESDKFIEDVYNYLKLSPDVSGYFRQVPNYIVGCNSYDNTFLKYKYPVLNNKIPLLVTSKNIGLSNAASLIYRKHWDIVKFRDVLASEDFFWAKEVIENNLKICYFGMLNVQHSHKETHESIHKRVRINAKARFPNGIGWTKRAIIFLKVFTAISFNSWNIVDSFKYACTHSSAYKNLNDQ